MDVYHPDGRTTLKHTVQHQEKKNELKNMAGIMGKE